MCDLPVGRLSRGGGALRGAAKRCPPSAAVRVSARPAVLTLPCVVAGCARLLGRPGLRRASAVRRRTALRPDGPGGGSHGPPPPRRRRPPGEPRGRGGG